MGMGMGMGMEMAVVVIVKEIEIALLSSKLPDNDEKREKQDKTNYSSRPFYGGIEIIIEGHSPS